MILNFVSILNFIILDFLKVEWKFIRFEKILMISSRMWKCVEAPKRFVLKIRFLSFYPNIGIKKLKLNFILHIGIKN